MSCRGSETTTIKIDSNVEVDTLLECGIGCYTNTDCKGFTWTESDSECVWYSVCTLGESVNGNEEFFYWNSKVGTHGVEQYKVGNTGIILVA